MNLSQHLQQLRQQHGFSQEELASRLRVARQTISKWETGQALPELPSLLDLCDLYGISLDHLVRHDDCTPAAPASLPESDPLTHFILCAKRATYAAHGAEIPLSLPGCHEYAFASGDWRYQDIYCGSSHFSGSETVWHRDVPVWRMSYAGHVTGEPFSGDFLKEALLLGTEAQPCRGPQFYHRGDWTYLCRSEGTLEWICGQEQIFYREHPVYELRFHGMSIR